MFLVFWGSLSSEQTISLKITVYVFSILIQGAPEAALSCFVPAGKKNCDFPPPPKLSILKLRTGWWVMVFHPMWTCPDTPFSLLTIPQAGIRGQTRRPSFGFDSQDDQLEGKATGRTGS